MNFFTSNFKTFYKAVSFIFPVIRRNVYCPKYCTFEITCKSCGLSDHDVKVMKLYNINTPRQSTETQIVRHFKKHSKTKFKINLSYEKWENIFCENDANIIFSKFPNSYIRKFFTLVLLRNKYILNRKAILGWQQVQRPYVFTKETFVCIVGTVMI
jgi:hypothetical protein